MTNALRMALRYPLQEEAGDKGAGGGEGGDKGKKGAEGGEAELGTIEERARRMGWAPQDEFRGAKEKWTDAATFVKNGEESLPILRERMRTMERTNSELSRSVSEFKTQSEANFKKGYEKAKRELEAEIKMKAKAGDDEGAAAAATELADLEGEKARREAASKDDPVFNAWELQNDWYKDPELREEAEVEAFRLRRKGEKAEGEAFLDKVKDAVKKKHPDKFTNPRRQNGSGQVERSGGGGDESTQRGGKKGWEHLPADAKDAGERYVKQKLYKDKAAYAAAYWEQN